jgi:hypothetical protein
VTRFTGHAIGVTNWAFNIAAIRVEGIPPKVDGSATLTRGVVLDPLSAPFPSGLARTSVVELVSPSGAYPHWCVHVVGQSPAEILGLDVLVYIKNIGDGQTTFDEVAIGGQPSANCAAFPAPDGEFVPAITGDFKESH